MNILIVNQPLNNRGDESAHRALVRSITKYIPNVNVRVLFMGANADSVRQFEVKDKRVQYSNTQHKHWLKARSFLKHGLRHRFLWYIHPYVIQYLNEFRWADAVICAPGGICMGGFMNWDHEQQLLYAMKFKRPIFYYGRSIGPFWDSPADKKLFKEQAISILKYSSFVSLRESASIRIAKELGIKKAVETTDTAFLDYPQVEIPQEVKQAIGDSPYVAYVPNILIWHYFYAGKATKQEVIDFWSKIADVITSHYPNYKIVMLPQTFNFGNYENDDILLFKDIQKNRPKANIIVLSDHYSSDVQQQIIRGADAMFGARYHSIVFAINNNVPFVAFSYEHKISGLLEELGLQDEMIDITSLFSSETFNKNVIDTFDKLLPSIHKSPVAQKKAKDISMSSFKKFEDSLKGLKCKK